MGSDGVWDNLYDRDILTCVNTHNDLSNISRCISTSAEIKGYDPSYKSPFSTEAEKHKR